MENLSVPEKAPFFAVIEGLDGSGKATQTALLAENLRNRGIPVQTLSFPDYESVSSVFVKMYLAGDFGQVDDVGAYEASAFYSIDRYVSFKLGWGKLTEKGGVLLADRYTTSNLCHQMSKLARDEWKSYTEWLYDYEYVKLGLPKPDAVIYLDMHPDVSEKLLQVRYGGDESKKDIHERARDYLLLCREAALFSAESLGWHKISCSDEHTAFSPEKIAGEILETLKKYLEI